MVLISANTLGDVIRNLSVEYKYPAVESKYCVFVLFIFRTPSVASELRMGNARDPAASSVTATRVWVIPVNADNISHSENTSR